MDTKKEPESSTDWLSWLATRRDGFLLGGAVLYGLGYLVWSYNAWRNHLGQLPALEFQYFMSGIIPAIIIGLAWTATRFFTQMRHRMLSFFEKHPSLRWISPGIILLFQGIFALGLLGTEKHWINLGWTKDQLSKYTAPVLFAVLYFAVLTNYTSRRKPSRGLVDKSLSLQKYYIAAAFCWYSLVVYFDLYPHLPQALGGPEPRCAFIDLVREDIGRSTLTALVPSQTSDSATTTPPKIVRSRQLNVYFSSNDYLLVRTAADTKDDTSSALKNTPLYELRKEVIRVVQWCQE